MKAIRPKIIAASLALLHLPAVLANPQDGKVVAGSVTIKQETPTKLGITQTSDKAIVDWKSFSIAANEHTQFYQPSASSVILNRVTGEDPSQILGRMTANGQVFLVNPNGVFFGKDAVIDVAGLVASTHNIRNEDFMAGRYKFDMPGKPGASVINEGDIRIADTGIAAFVAPSVSNRGVIAARLGKVTLAAANGFTLDFAGDRLLTFLVNDEVAQTAFDIEGKRLTSFVENSGKIEAQGGYVLLTARAAENAIHGVINHSGSIEATTVGVHNGEIILNAGKGSLSVSGTLDASAPNGGNGGFVETSGSRVDIDSSTKITTAAPFGKTGTWLIDPNDFTIAATGGNITGGTLAGQLLNNAITIQTATQGTAGGNGDIFVNDSVSWSSGTTLYLQAERNVVINSPINAANVDSALRVDAPGTLTISGTGSVSVGDVGYRANDVNLIGSTWTSAASVGISAYDYSRAVRIESSPTAGVLSLTPAELATLHAPSGYDIHVGRGANSGSLTVTAALGSADVHAGDLGLYGTSIAVNAPINLNAGGTGVFLEAGSGGVQINAPVNVTGARSYLSVETPGTLTVSGAGSVSSDGSVYYRANDMTLVGATTTTTSTYSLDIYPYDSSRAVRIESSPTAGVLSLTPAEISTLNAPNTDINIGLRTTGDVAVNASLDYSQLHSAYFGLMGANVSINAPITSSKVLVVETPGTLTVNANVTATGPGGDGGDAVVYQANNMALNGITTAIAGTASIQPYDPTRSIRIESAAMAGNLSLTPEQFATLHADADRDIVLYTPNGNITFAAPLASNQINSGYLGVKTPGGSILVNEPIRGGAGMGGMEFQAGVNVTFNALVTPVPGVTAGGVITHTENLNLGLTAAQALLVQQHQNDNPAMLLNAIGHGLFYNSTRDPVWVGMYQNGAATSAQVTANSLWPIYDKYRLATVSKLLDGLNNGDIVYGGTIWTALGSPSYGNMNNRNAAYYMLTHPSSVDYLSAYSPVTKAVSDSANTTLSGNADVLGFQVANQSDGTVTNRNTHKNRPKSENGGVASPPFDRQFLDQIRDADVSSLLILLSDSKLIIGDPVWNALAGNPNRDIAYKIFTDSNTRPDSSGNKIRPGSATSLFDKGLDWVINEASDKRKEKTGALLEKTTIGLSMTLGVLEKVSAKLQNDANNAAQMKNIVATINGAISGNDLTEYKSVVLRLPAFALAGADNVMAIFGSGDIPKFSADVMAQNILVTALAGQMRDGSYPAQNLKSALVYKVTENSKFKQFFGGDKYILSDQKVPVSEAYPGLF